MNSISIHQISGGIAVETEWLSALISENDLPLLNRGQPVPLRDENKISLGHKNYVLTRNGDVVITMSKVDVTVPSQLWNLVRHSERNVVLNFAEA